MRGCGLRGTSERRPRRGVLHREEHRFLGAFRTGRCTKSGVFALQMLYKKTRRLTSFKNKTQELKHKMEDERMRSEGDIRKAQQEAQAARRQTEEAQVRPSSFIMNPPFSTLTCNVKRGMV